MGAENAMSIRIGYLLPTLERIMAGQPQAARYWNWLSELSAWASILPGPVHQRNRRPQSGISRLPATFAELRITDGRRQNPAT
jgi:hypothetical protein